MTKKLSDLKPFKGGTRKISDLPDAKTCQDKEHNPPMHVCLPDGVYEHVCPSCGKRQVFTIRKPTMGVTNEDVYDDETLDSIRGTEDGI